jgi:hypothetical protein
MGLLMPLVAIGDSWLVSIPFSIVIRAERRQAREPGPKYPCAAHFAMPGHWVPDGSLGAKVRLASRPG